MDEATYKRLRKSLVLSGAELSIPENMVDPGGRTADEVAYFLSIFDPSFAVRAQTPDRKHTFKIVNLEEDDFNGLPVLGLVEVEDYNGDENPDAGRKATEEV